MSGAGGYTRGYTRGTLPNNNACISKEKTYEMSVLQTIDSKEYVCWSFPKSKNRNGKPQKRKAGAGLSHSKYSLIYS